jgi:diguanylate cyclase (GGDEF)-like protein/PAS domain S-box-containing protein
MRIATPITIELLRELAMGRSPHSTLSAAMSAAFAQQTDLPPASLEQRLPDEQLQLVRVAVERASEGIAIMTPAGDATAPVTLYVNPSFCRITGMEREEVVGRPLRIFRVDSSDQALHDALRHPLCQRRAFEGEALAVRKSGATYPLELLLVPVHDAAEEVVQWVAYLSDATERRAQIAALQHQALHDVLTGLPNRVLLNDRLQQAVMMTWRAQGRLGLLLMDLDRFKEINDTFGHHCGDLLLQQAARRLKEQIQDSDTVARLGGDEFAILLPMLRDASDANRVARRILKAFQKPFIIDGRRVEVGASIGISISPDHGADAGTLLRRADAAMYVAKKTGIGCALYYPQQEKQTAEELALGGELREAIEQNQLLIFYQPKVDLRTGMVTRVEALSRWQHPRRGLLVPDDFIPLAERTGLIKPLTDWVLEQSLRQCHLWQRSGYPMSIAVNLSSKSLQEHFLPQTVSDLLDKWSVKPDTLKLEITESSILGDTSHALAILSLLQTLGVTLSLDDFGTGYSSLTHLRHLPVDEIKIDKSFVLGMQTSGSDAAIVRATIDLAHNLGRKVVAEGVADPRTGFTLNELGCDLAQGYCFTPPVPAAAVEQWLTENDWGITAWRQMMVAGAPRGRRASH